MSKLWKYLSVSIMFCSQAHAEQTKTLEDVIEDVNTAVVSIIADSKDSQTLGAGIIIGADGYVVTNSHVTENTDKITVVSSDDIEYMAELVGADTKTDVALLKVSHPKGFEPAHFTDSDKVRVGNSVFAIGNPFGLGNSVSLGIISAKERDIEKGPYDNFLQTDATINQGNSGGPLFNMKGEIVGINTAIFSTDGTNTGVGFATPANQVQWVVSELKKNGKVIRGWLGIGVQKIRSNEMEDKNKLVVASMSEGSPAEKAGIKVGDVITKAGNLSLHNPRLFSQGIAEISPGKSLLLEVMRDNKMHTIEAKIATMPENYINESKKDDSISIVKGLTTEQIKKAVTFPELGIKAYFDAMARDFVIVSVKENSDAAHKGVEVGNRFSIVNGKKVFGVEDMQIRIKQASATGKMEFQLIGDEDIDTVILNLEQPNE